jgi:hypothetical protein
LRSDRGSCAGLKGAGDASRWPSDGRASLGRTILLLEAVR